MYLFLITFFFLYSLLHFYAFLKLKAAFALSTQGAVLTVLIMLIMIFAPIIVRLSEKAGLDPFARLMSYAGYTWMGLLVLFFSTSFVIDIYRFFIYISGLILRKDLVAFIPSARVSFFIPLMLSILTAVYGYFEAQNIRMERITISTPKIPEWVGRLRIVQISDVHLGLIVREERLKRVLREVKRAGPDILVSTGDLVDGQINSLTGLAAILNEIQPRYGKFAITGNHEFYAGLDQALDFTEKAGFKMLRGEILNIAGMINVVGVDDPQGKTYGLHRGVPEKELLSGVSEKTFTLLLKHRPIVDKSSLDLFDLQLSGHVHNGQIFPFSLITGLYYSTQAGFAKLSNKSFLYVSRGSGTWGPPVRVLSPPEVTVIELVHGDERLI
jgi:predicted MPP superfamily phosphohydrolase